MSKPTARICDMLSERLQKMRRRTSSGLAHTSSAQAGWSSLSGGGGGGPMPARIPGRPCMQRGARHVILAPCMSNLLGTGHVAWLSPAAITPPFSASLA